MQTLPTKLEGPILLVPTVHGDERGFFQETYRATRSRNWHARRLRPGQPLALARAGAARDAPPGRRRHREAGPLRARRDPRRDRRRPPRLAAPTAAGRASRSTTATTISSRCPVGFAHGFCVLSEVADVIYRQTGYYDPALERGDRLRRSRRSGSSGRLDRVHRLRRDRTAPPLREVAADCRSVRVRGCAGVGVDGARRTVASFRACARASDGSNSPRASSSCSRWRRSWR